MCLTWGSWADCVSLHKYLVPLSGRDGVSVHNPGWTMGFTQFLDSLMGIHSDSDPRVPSQVSWGLFQATDEAGALLSTFLDFLVVGVRLVSGRVLLLERKEKRTCTEVPSKVGCRGVLVRSVGTSPGP